MYSRYGCAPCQSAGRSPFHDWRTWFTTLRICGAKSLAGILNLSAVSVHNTQKHAHTRTSFSSSVFTKSGAGHRYMYPLDAPSLAQVCLTESLMHDKSLFTNTMLAEGTVLFQFGQSFMSLPDQDSPASPALLRPTNHILIISFFRVSNYDCTASSLVSFT